MRLVQGLPKPWVLCNARTDREIKGHNDATIATDNTTGHSIASRTGVSRGSKQVQLRLLYMRAVFAQGIVRLRKVGTKEKLAALHSKYLPVDQF